MSEDLKVLTTVGDEAEAAVVRGRLADAGIRSLEQASGGVAQWNPGASIEIYVAAEDLERAHAALDVSADG
jgi:Putative prokaryotic signal transducing protein